MALNQNTLLKLAERDGANCHYCAHELDPDGPLRPTVDHIVPRFLNGSNRLHNLVLACDPCNRRKGNAMLHFDCDQCNAARAAEARHRVLRSSASSVRPSDAGHPHRAWGGLVGVSPCEAACNGSGKR